MRAGGGGRIPQRWVPGRKIRVVHRCDLRRPCVRCAHLRGVYPLHLSRLQCQHCWRDQKEMSHGKVPGRTCILLSLFIVFHFTAQVRIFLCSGVVCSSSSHIFQMIWSFFFWAWRINSESCCCSRLPVGRATKTQPARTRPGQVQ